MTALMFNVHHDGSTRPVISTTWTVHPRGTDTIMVDGHGLNVARVIVDLTMDEFVAMVQDGGKIIDLRKFQT
jgi:hypothetical protein